MATTVRKGDDRSEKRRRPFGKLRRRPFGKATTVYETEIGSGVFPRSMVRCHRCGSEKRFVGGLLRSETFCSSPFWSHYCRLVRPPREQLTLKFARSLLGSEFRDWLPPPRAQITGRVTRNNHKLNCPKARTKRYLNSCVPYMTRLVNQHGQ
ncbi:hypothetical protein Bbelb_339560 [Branchiostoma belcheri]|nr:hypothetical protein Bbelb_339560 [Branchiostoma belcheri]